MTAANDNSAVAHLRAATRSDHDAVDGAFARYALSSRQGYRDFLTAHARILPLAERLIDPAALVPDWRGRSDALAADLAELGEATPEALDFALPEGEAARWGALYVLEGSRLGGVFLAKSVPAAFPAAYLNAKHAPGAWRDLLGALEAADEGAEWQADAAAGAKALFGAYLAAARA
jgi:heme oxygenase (biliverdin-IX-beta and delta-forming)